MDVISAIDRRTTTGSLCFYSDVDTSEDECASPPAFSETDITPLFIASINKQVEFYFSDANLPTDKKLHRLIQKDPEGYVSIRLFANFRKIRALTKDVDAIATALLKSEDLVVSSDRRNVKRLVPVPDEYDIPSIQRRIVVAEELPIGPTIESVTDMFSEFGTVKVVRICTKDSKGRLPTWLSLGCMNPNSHHAYVEFNEEHEAVKAASASYLSLSSPGKDQNTRVKVHLLTDRLEYLANNPEPILSPSSSPTPATLPLAPAEMSRWNSSGGMVASSRSSRDASPNVSRWGGQPSSDGSLKPRSSVDHVANVPQRKVTGIPPHPFVESQRWHRRTSPSVPIPGPLSLGMEGAAQPRVVGFTHGGILTTENENEGEALLSKTSSRDEERERSSWGSDRPSFSIKGSPNQQEAYVPPSRRSREGSPCLSPAPALSPLAQPFTLESLAASINTAGSPYSPVTAFHAMSPTPPPPSSINQETNSRVALSAMISQIMGSAKDDAAEVKGKKKPSNHDDARRVSQRDDASDYILVNQASDLIGRLLIGIPPVVSSGANGAAMKPPLSRRTQDDGGLATRDLNNARRSTVHVLKPAPASSEAVMITTRGSDGDGQDSSLLTSSYYPTSSDQFSRHSSTICSEASGTFNSYGASEEGEAEDDDEEYGAGAGGGLKKKRTRRSKRGRKTVDLVNVQATALAPSAVNASAGNRRMTTGCVSGAERTAPLVTLPPTFPGVVAKKDYASCTTPHVSVAPAYVVSKGPDGTRGFAGRNRTVS